MRRFFHPERVALFLVICLSVYFLLLVQSARAGTIPEASSPKMDCEATISIWESDVHLHISPGDCKCVNGQPVCGNSSSGGRGVAGNSLDINQQIKMQVVGTIFQSLLTSLFSDNTTDKKEALAAQQKAAALAAQQAAMDREKAREAEAAYEKMMQSYKQLDDSQGVAFKTLSDSSMDFKTLDSDAETLEANARKPFDTASETAAPASKKQTGNGATPFFGDAMPGKEIRFLVNPENDPNVVDLRGAVSYVAQNMKSGTDPEHAKGEPLLRGPNCKQLSERLTAYINQRTKFQKTIDLAQSQLDIWEKANRDALLSAAKDGLNYFTGELFEAFQMRIKAADRLEQILKKNAEQMARDGLNVAEIGAKIKRLRLLSSAKQISELTRNITDWQDFIKDGLSSLMAQLTASNRDIREILNDPRMQEYFGQETPALNALLDITKIAASYKVLGEWVAKKIPIIGGVELATNLLYDGTAYLLSFHRLAKANNINGRVLDTARYIQKNIDDTYLAFRSCS
jgi:type II secretory pathway pseudopilin PulG